MRRTLLPFLFILSLIACCIEVDISAPGFPGMAEDFAVSDNLIQLTIAYNFLGFFLAGLFYGPLSECYGRRRMMIVGNALLLVGAVGCVFAPSIYWLLVSRFIQGIGASASAVVVFAMIADLYQGSRAAKLIAMMNSVLTIIITIAPVAGGFINAAVGWRGNYAIVALVCLVSWIALFFMLPETKAARARFELKKALKDYRKLLTSTAFVSASFAPSLLYAAYMSFVACGPFLYMDTFGLSTIAYALHQGAIVACFSLISLLSGRITRRIGESACISKGKALCMMGSIAMVGLSLIAPHSPYLMTSCMILFASGFALCYPIIFAASLEIFPEIKGAASSAIMAMRALTCAVFVGLTGYFYDGDPLAASFVILSAVAIGCALMLSLRTKIESRTLCR